jgi:hypothetical protein
MCAQGNPPGEPRITYEILAGMCVELALLALAAYKAWQNRYLVGTLTRRRGEPGTMMNSLAWDAIFYFFPIFAVYVAAEAISIHNDVSTHSFQCSLICKVDVSPW